MWPSEGSVSSDIVPMFAKNGISWIATDEEILFQTLGETNGSADNGVLYKPYKIIVGKYSVNAVFRDHKLSDLIGFVYHKMNAEDAANDFIERLIEIKNTSNNNGGTPSIVSIILDGENCWEYYKNSGYDFLNSLYTKLSNEEKNGLITTTVSEYLAKFPPKNELKGIFPGSWINGNFGIWIGHTEDNQAWDYLSQTRKFLLSRTPKTNPPDNIKKAWEEIYIAEGSDWNWWYGDEHQTETQEEFDELFRLNLMKVYKVIGKETPPNLFVPVLRENRAISPEVIIRGFINPKIDGLVTSYYEWYQGAHLAVGKSGGSMHRAESLVSHIYYGFNQSTLFLRIDPKTSINDFPPDTTFSINIAKPFAFRVNVAYRDGIVQPGLFEKKNGEWEKIKDITEAAMQDILEIAIPFKDIKAKAEDELSLFITAYRGNEEIERCPWRGNISITVPTPDFEATMWY
ncbi:MAG TPA: hypothetical protein DDX12_08655 [Nitrospiraceae bacterium]|nr:hypothetical protein [Nitrospiraceae bacterium]